MIEGRRRICAAVLSDPNVSSWIRRVRLLADVVVLLSGCFSVMVLLPARREEDVVGISRSNAGRTCAPHVRSCGSAYLMRVITPSEAQRAILLE
jgi:hypothetical protein